MRISAVIVILICLISGPFNSSLASDDARFSIFKAHDETSTVVIGLGMLDQLLSRTVYLVGRSQRWTARRREMKTGTRIQSSNLTPSWLEGNRVFFHKLGDEQIAALSEYRRLLERLPGAIGFDNLSRNEQLAYWLNLYSLTVYEQVALRYPVTTLERLRRGKPGKPGLWDQELLLVAGVPLSLNDIQNNILIPIWQTPLVLYGLFQGSIGGPSIGKRAFRSRTVHDQLRKNAEEFVNSVRGVQRNGGSARVSLLYEWGAAAFPNGDADLKRHLTAFADDKTRDILDGADDIVADYFDWNVADLYNGRKGEARMYATVLNNAIFAGSGAIALGAVDDIGYNILNPIPESALPLHTAKFLRAINNKFRVYGNPNTRVTIEDIETDVTDDQPDKSD